MRIEYIDIRDSEEGKRSDAIWLCDSVAYLYTQEAIRRKLSTVGLRRINIRFGGIERPWDGVTQDGVADVWVHFDAQRLDLERPFESQLYVLDQLELGLRKLSPPNGLAEEQIAGIHSALVQSRFSAEFVYRPAHKIVAGEVSARIAIVAICGFDHVTLAARIKRGRATHDATLVEMWPSMYRVFLKLREIRLDSGSRLVLRFRDAVQAQSERRLFGRRSFELVAANVEPTVTRNGDFLELGYPVADLLKELARHASR